MRVVRFYHSCSSPPSPLPLPRQSSSPTSSPILIAKLLANPLRQFLIAVGTAGPQLPASDRSLDLNRQRIIPVGIPGPQPPALYPSGHPWTSTASFRSQWAPLDLNDQISSPNIFTKHHHNTSSQSIITNHYHRSFSQSIITIHHHKI